MPSERPYTITTPIYYVNDRPHVGHCYTTLVADAAARFMRASGRQVFFLTGTDEHAEKVVDTARERGLTPIQWADHNAAQFERAFAFIASSHDDFVRTTQKRHTEKVERYVRGLVASGDIYLGEYQGWYDVSQEEYVTESTAREHHFNSPVTGKPLVKRTEKNYFFRLSKYQDRLRAHIEANPGFIKPEARRNEVMGRLAEGLQDVPASRAVVAGDPRSSWGILMPDDPGHRIYVWIDALFNYLSVVDNDDRRANWPASVHVMAKDILWFHAVIWPCLLMAMGRELPGCVYAHAYWIREGRKMSKSLGNFLDLETIEAYCAPWGSVAGQQTFGLDALRWFLLTQGPLEATDSDFAHAKFVEVYNADLANGIGNAASRVCNMIEKYFCGKCPEPGATPGDSAHDWPKIAASAVEQAVSHAGAFRLGEALAAGLELTKRVDGFIHATEPFKLAKDPANLPRVGRILYDCAEALRIAAVLLSPAMPGKMGDLLARLGQPAPDAKGRFFVGGVQVGLSELCAWGRLAPGTPIVKGEALFPRADGALPAPTPIAPAPVVS